jgi:hypothetical protein
MHVQRNIKFCSLLLCLFLLLQFSTFRTVSIVADIVVFVVADRCEIIRKKMGGKGAAEGLK